MSTQDQAKVLIVDDEDAIRSGLASALRRANFEVIEARDGLDALEKVEKHQPDIIVLDILMPVLDGREVCRRLRQDEDWTPVIMLTQISATGEKISSLEEGAGLFPEMAELFELSPGHSFRWSQLGPSQRWDG